MTSARLAWLPQLAWPMEAVGLLLAFAEAAIVWLVVTLALGVPSHDPAVVSPGLMLALVLATTLIPRLMDATDVWDRQFEVAMIGCVIATLLFGLKTLSFPHSAWMNSGWLRDAVSELSFHEQRSVIPAWGVVALLAAMWGRGRFRAEPSVESAQRVFRVGLIVVLGAAIVLASMDDQVPSRRVRAAIAVFMGTSLFAIGLARAIDSGNGTNRELTRRSVVTAAIPATGAVLVAELLAGILSHDLLETLLWIVGPLLWALSVIFRAVVLLIAVIGMLILAPILWLLSGRHLGSRAIRPDVAPESNTNVVRQTTEHANNLPDPIRYLAALLILSLIVWAVTRFMLKRGNKLKPVDANEERSFELPSLRPRNLLSAVRSLWTDGTDEGGDPLAGLRGNRAWAATIRMRERYAEFLTWCLTVGEPRRHEVTPVEHARSLDSRFAGPGARADLAAAVAVYGRARYGVLPLSNEDADAAIAALDRLQTQARTEQ